MWQTKRFLVSNAVSKMNRNEFKVISIGLTFYETSMHLMNLKKRKNIVNNNNLFFIIFLYRKILNNFEVAIQDGGQVQLTQIHCQITIAADVNQSREPIFSRLLACQI